MGSDMVMKKIWILVLAVVMFTACGDDSLRQDKEEILSFIEDIDGTEDFYVSLEEFLKPQRNITPENCKSEDIEAVMAYISSLEYNEQETQKHDPDKYKKSVGGVSFAISVKAEGKRLNIDNLGTDKGSYFCSVVKLYDGDNNEPVAEAVFDHSVRAYIDICRICGVET